MRVKMEVIREIIAVVGGAVHYSHCACVVVGS